MGFVKGDPNNPGRKFTRGMSGNPKGRPAAIIEVAKAAREHTAEALETLAAIMRDKKATASARVSAAVAILERAWGKAPQTIDLRRLDPNQMKEIADDELIAIIAADDEEPHAQTNGSNGAAVEEANPREPD
jgi:hypothetical protein